MNDALRVAQLAMMLSSDWSKGALDALYVPGLSKGMLEAPGILAFVAQKFFDEALPSIAFNGSDGEAFGSTVPGSAWPGKAYYIAELTNLGVPPDRLVPTGPGLHSRGEMEALVLTAKERGWKRIGITTIPYHFPRAFAFLPGAFKMHDWRPDVFALNPPSTDWYLEMGASQGKGTTTPEAAALDDAAKVLDQITKGWAAPLDEIFAYLRSRTR